MLGWMRWFHTYVSMLGLGALALWRTRDARRRTVVIGVETDERIEITSGVSAGELVITRGQTGLEDGAAISAAIER